MLAVAAGDEIAVDALRPPLALEGDMRRGAGQPVELDVVHLVQNLAAGGFAGGVQVFRDGRLAVGHHALAGVFPGVDEEPPVPGPDDRGPVMHMPFPVHPLAEANVAQQLHRTRLQHAGADALHHMGLGTAFEDDALYPLQVQDVGQQEARGPAADDRHLSSHDSLPDTASPGITHPAPGVHRPLPARGAGPPRRCIFLAASRQHAPR